ncbi:MAG: glycosyltransferase family 2 protein, partial [Bacteroidia bacterium]|nr:glycosyltransferase family 2 protein [Bacteroidia bacterium]MDW8334954.1 glycosyltransferase family 2 protein [Bacteroidia bacterium]
LADPKIRIVDTVWDPNLRTGGSVLARQTDLALAHVQADWAFYIQADEVLHERFLDRLYELMKTRLDDRRVEGLLFDYLHFYGDYDYVGASLKWYRKEVRIVRTGVGVVSWKDAQGFRRFDGRRFRKLRVVETGACIHHYGWVKAPETQALKARHFNRYWHDDAWIEEHVPEVFEYDPHVPLRKFDGEHPAVMRARIERRTHVFVPRAWRAGLVDRLRIGAERYLGLRPFHYKNYVLI